MKRISCILILLTGFIAVMDAQDIILKRNGEEVPAKVTDVSKTEVKYKKFSNLDGPAYVMLVSDIFMIKYENGDKDVFDIEEEAEIPQEAAEITAEASNTPSTDTGYALLHVYRSGSVGALISYDLHLGDAVICRVSTKTKETIRVTQEGLKILWARTESKAELPIDIQFGKEYYICCGMKMGIFVGRPKIELVDNKRGEAEFQTLQGKNK
jgi:hypothetical protein